MRSEVFKRESKNEKKQKIAKINIIPFFCHFWPVNHLIAFCFCSNLVQWISPWVEHILQVSSQSHDEHDDKDDDPHEDDDHGDHDADYDETDLKVFFQIRHEVDYQPTSCLHVDRCDDYDDDDDDDDDDEDDDEDDVDVDDDNVQEYEVEDDG